MKYMDPITIGLASSIMGVLMPFVKKGAEEFISSAGKDAYEKSKTILENLKSRLSGDEEAVETLKHFEEKPERYKSAVEDILREKLAQDKGLAGELQRMLKDMGPNLDIIQKMKTAENVTGLQVDKIMSVRAKVIQEIERAKDVTGAKIKRIG
jgi:hypothetical protein